MRCGTEVPKVSIPRLTREIKDRRRQRLVSFDVFFRVVFHSAPRGLIWKGDGLDGREGSERSDGRSAPLPTTFIRPRGSFPTMHLLRATARRALSFTPSRGIASTPRAAAAAHGHGHGHGAASHHHEDHDHHDDHHHGGEDLTWWQRRKRRCTIDGGRDGLLRRRMALTNRHAWDLVASLLTSRSDVRHAEKLAILSIPTELAHLDLLLLSIRLV